MKKRGVLVLSQAEWLRAYALKRNGEGDCNIVEEDLK